MAPGYRNSNRRQHRTGYVDHDVFEGLPVRHWRRDFVTVAPGPTQENTISQNDVWAIELPHGMPKDSHLLPQHSQDLLRAARSGRIYKRPAPVEEEEAAPEGVSGDKPEKKDDDAGEKGFSAKAWKQIPRQMEGPDIEYLAKRRKGLVTLGSKAVAARPTLTRTTLRRTDAAGNEYVQDIIIPRGQEVEGEVISQTVIPDPAAADPTPPKRKNAPPKNKKHKGPGRGKRKKQIAPTSVPENIQGGELTQSVERGAEGTAGPNDVKIESTENGTGVSAPPRHEDTEMAEGSIAASDDEGGEEGDEGDDDDGSVSALGSPSKPPRPSPPVVSELPHMREIPDLDSLDTVMSGTDPLSTPLPKHETETSEGKAGSPLKNVALTSSNLTSPMRSPAATQDPFTETNASQQPVEEASSIPEPSKPAEATILDEKMQQETNETALPTLPPPPPDPTVAEIISSTEVRREEEEEEQMLLDIVEKNSNANLGAAIPTATAPEVPNDPTPLPREPSAPEPVQEKEHEQGPDPQSEKEDIPTSVEPATSEGKVEQTTNADDDGDDDDDDFNDLLGGLEKRLNEPQAPPPPPPAAATSEPEPGVGVGVEVGSALEPEPEPESEIVQQADVAGGEEKGDGVLETKS